MSLSGVFYLGVRYLARNRAKTLLMVFAFTLVWSLPSAIGLLVSQAEIQLRARAETTPLLLGHAGSALELTFNGLYFTKPDITTLPLSEYRAATESGLVQAIPLYARFSAGGYPIVATTIDYLRFRGLHISEGRSLLRLGECVVGSKVAQETGVTPGDSLISSPETLFDLAGVYPLKMSVCGVLSPTGTADDEAVFVDLKTAWIIEGLGHGHVEASAASQDEKLDGNGDEIRLNASVVEYNEITPENVDSFHFHGSMEDHPITAVILVPRDAKSQALVKGRYAPRDEVQLISPSEEMIELFETVFSVQRLVVALLAGTGVATLLIGVLVFLLSYRLRKSEFFHLKRLGASVGSVRTLVMFEGGFVVATSLFLSLVLLFLLGISAPGLIRWILT
ncbi:MAG: ABC transporter permease [Verrucomicrobiota bacterium]